MIPNVGVEDILFVDIETVPASPQFSQMNEVMRQLWEKKSKNFRSEEENPAVLYERAGLYAEFGKVICISSGFMTGTTFRIKSVFGDDEKTILGEFASLVARWSGRKDPWLCGHNAKDFDFPFLARRMIINRVGIPDLLNTAGRKPWEVKQIDTMEMWKFGDYKYFTSLALLAAVFDLPTPKDDIDGSMVSAVYWQERDIERIVRYCEKDVLTVARILMRFLGRDDISDSKVESLTRFQ